MVSRCAQSVVAVGGGRVERRCRVESVKMVEEVCFWWDWSWSERVPASTVGVDGCAAVDWGVEAMALVWRRDGMPLADGVEDEEEGWNSSTILGVSTAFSCDDGTFSTEITTGERRTSPS